MQKRFRLAPHQFRWDRRLLAAMVLATLALMLRGWLVENPQHNPWAPLDLRDPPGWATSGKLSVLRDDPASCREVLERSEVAFVALPKTGQGACQRADRTVLAELPLSPVRPAMTCPMAAGVHHG